LKLERQTGRWTDGYTEEQNDFVIDRFIYGQTYGWMNKQVNGRRRQTDRQTDRQMYWWAHKYTKQTDRCGQKLMNRWKNTLTDLSRDRWTDRRTFKCFYRLEDR
jgi:hypothetical protein